MRTRGMCRVSLNPTCFQVLPASVDFHMPVPCETLPRTVFSPPPTKMTFGSDSLTATAPIEPPKKPSEMLSQVEPPSVVRQTPPPTDPKYKRSGRPGTPVTAAD